MIATHNIKVNGRWIHSGEEYDPNATRADITPTLFDALINAPTADDESKEETSEKAKSARAKTTPRRKVSK